MTAEIYLAYVLACILIAIIPGPRQKIGTVPVVSG